MAIIVNKVGIFLLDCIMGKEGITGEAVDFAKCQFSIVLTLAYKCLGQDCISVSLNVMELLNHFLAALKHMKNIELESVNMLL